jgi:hypothetical protein
LTVSASARPPVGSGKLNAEVAAVDLAFEVDADSLVSVGIVRRLRVGRRQLDLACDALERQLADDAVRGDERRGEGRLGIAVDVEEVG